MALGKNTINIKFDGAGLQGLLDELAEDAAQAIRPAAQAAAQVLYDRVKLNVNGIGKITGNLASAIYQAYSPENSKEGVTARYNVSWNASKAPHGHLLEYGYLQRYRYYQNNQGQIRPMVRPGMEGKKRPGRRASQAAKDAYYVALPAPVQVPGRAFVRNAASAMPEAYQAAEDELIRRIQQKGAK